MRALRRRVVHKYWTRPAERLRAGEEMAAILEGKRRILETRERIQALESRVPRPGRRKVPSDCVGRGLRGIRHTMAAVPISGIRRPKRLA
jgi:hypothetical protein